MSDDHAKPKTRAYEAIATAADVLAAAHEGGCPVGRLMSAVAREARRNADEHTRGPSQVATDRYRDSWERTFSGRPATVGRA